MSATVPDGAEILLNLIASKEAPGGYDTIYGNNQDKLGEKLTLMTLEQVIAQGPLWTKEFKSSACGRYQFLTATLKGLRVSESLTGSEQFDQSLQDRLGYALLEQCGYENFLGAGFRWAILASP